MADGGFCEVGQRGADSFIMRRTGHPMDANGEGVFLLGGEEVGPQPLDALSF